MDIERALKTIGDWISKETESRKYPKGELLELSESLQALKATIARQSATSEEVQRAISWAQGMEIFYTEKQMPECANCAKTAVVALQAYQPCISVNDRLPTEEDSDANGDVLAWSSELDEWQVERWFWVNRNTNDYTHWKSLPETPKGE